MKKLYLSTIILALTSQVFAEEEKKKKLSPRETVRQQKKLYETTTGYVHKWTKFPTVSGRVFLEGTPEKYEAEYGKTNVVIFVSSWCVSCQKLMDKIKFLERKYTKLSSKFVYIFIGDTGEDAKGFLKEFKLGNNAYLADLAVKKEFHNPQALTVYVSDRRQWLLERYEKTDAVGLNELDGLLSKLNAI